MGKIDTLQKYIDACDEKRNNRHDKYEFIQQVFGVYDNEIENISKLATIHDIGKISTPYEVLNKKGKLTKEEMSED